MNHPKLKAMLSRAGVLVPPRMIHFANGMLNYLNLGRWFHDRGLKVPVRCAEEESVASLVAPLVQEPASYLEFGVFKGESLRRWIGWLKHPETRFYGFDSFEGLPETWGPVNREYFDLAGAMPKFDDPRVRLVKGWFSNTLPPFLEKFKPHTNLVVFMDADLYSSTSFVLGKLRPFLRPGTIIMFDQIWDRGHELKAFSEFLDEQPCAIECLAASRALSQAAFRIVSISSATNVPAGKVSK